MSCLGGLARGLLILCLSHLTRPFGLMLSNDGVWGVRGFPFPTTNSLDTEGTIFHLPEVRKARERRGLATEEDQEESVHEGGEAHIPTLQPIHPPSNNARDYRIEAMIVVILHNQRREKEARLHIMACVHTIMEKMNILIHSTASPLQHFYTTKKKKDPPRRNEF
ncbi:unnamed protein product [Linum trigynum]|uniref:Secreted protein n=1 Tax=Linum trigynum TaxID=586398 RepID=A0AAV2EVL3_9ROSI